MKVTVIAVGKLKERFWKDACAEYLKRLGAYATTVVRELPDSDPTREGELIAAAVDGVGARGPDAHVVLLDIGGVETSSEGLAASIERLGVDGISHLVFIVGGSDGVSERVRQSVDSRLSFGPITLPHNLARVVLLEQIYRAFRIIRREPYHK